GLGAGLYTVIAAARSTEQGTLATQISVPASGATTAPDLVFTPLGNLAGRASLGAPSGNGGITVVVAGAAAVGVTDDAGNYLVRAVPTGVRDVVASRPGSASAATTVTVLYAQTATAPELVLGPAPARPGGIEGQVLLSGERTQP